jgi:hypothetical protein
MEVGMSAHMSSYENVLIQDYSYLIFVVFWNELETEFTKNLKEQAHSLGTALDELGFVVQPSKAKATYETAQQVREKEWPDEIISRFDSDQFPFILVIDSDFKSFNPQLHPWVIFWGSEDFYNTDQIYKLFGKILQLVKAGNNLFDYFKEHQKQPWYKKLFKHIEVKPGVFGVTVDAKGIIEESLG